MAVNGDRHARNFVLLLLLAFSPCSLFRPEDEGSTFFQNADLILPRFTVSHSRMQRSGWYQMQELKSQTQKLVHKLLVRFAAVTLKQ
jgi:hypothetical protein